MKEEFKKLLDMFRQGFSGNSGDIDAVMKESFVMFDRMKNSLYDASEEEKQELVNSMTEFYNELMNETKRFAQKMGVSEDQLFAISENPNHFTPDQWTAMQETKNQLFKVSMDMYSAIKPATLNFNALKKNSEGSSQERPPAKEKARPLRKEEWLRS